VPVTTKGDSLDVGPAQALNIGPLFTNRDWPYDVTADGRRILAALPVEQKRAPPLTLVQNWTERLSK